MAAPAHVTMDDINVLIVCALWKEAEAAIAVFKPHCTDLISTFLGTRPYYRGLCDHANIAIVWQPEMGMQETSNTLNTFLPHCNQDHLRLIVMSGICAGVQSATRLGDVVVADKVFDYSTGATISATSERSNIQTFNVDQDLQSWFLMQSSSAEWQQYILTPKPPTSRFVEGTILNAVAEQEQEQKQQTQRADTANNNGNDDDIVATVRSRVATAYAKSSAADIDATITQMLQSLDERKLVTHLRFTDAGRLYHQDERRNTRSVGQSFPSPP